MNRRCCCLLTLLLIAGLGSGVRAEDAIKPSPKLPAETPWDLAALSAPPSFEWVDRQSPVRSLLYQGEPYGGQETEVFAYYATPATLAAPSPQSDQAAEQAGPEQAPRYPAVVLVHGGGGTAFREWVELWAERGYAAIAMDLAGYRPREGTNAHRRENRIRLESPGPDQGDDEKFGSIAKPASEQWPYHAVASVVRAHSLLRSFPEVDPARTAVTGISWGGYLTCIVAGVDNRFRAAVPVYGCGYLHENSAWTERLTRMPTEQRQRWIRLWDPSRYVPAATMPMLFINGTNDFAYPLDSYMKTYDAVPGAKQIRITVNMPHGHPAGWAPREIGIFIDHHLRGAQGLPTVGPPTIEEGRVRMAYEGPVPLSQATLHFTTDRGAINERTWQSRPASVAPGKVTAESPPAESTAWFLTVTDQHQATVSTRVVVPEMPSAP